MLVCVYIYACVAHTHTFMFLNEVSSLISSPRWHLILINKYGKKVMLCFCQITTYIFHPSGMMTILIFPYQRNNYDSSTTLNIHSAAEGVIVLPCHGLHRHRNLHLKYRKEICEIIIYLMMRDRH